MGDKTTFKLFCVIWGLTELFHLASFIQQNGGPLAAVLAVAAVAYRVCSVSYFHTHPLGFLPGFR